MQTLREAMTKNLKTVPHYVTVQETARRMQAEKVGSLLVERGGQIVGIVTETDLVRKAVAKGSDLSKEKEGGGISAPGSSIYNHRTAQDPHEMIGDVSGQPLALNYTCKIEGLLAVMCLSGFF